MPVKDGQTLIYSEVDGKWHNAWGVDYEFPRLVWKDYTDFFSVGDNSNDPWIGAALIDGTCTARPGESNHPGIVRLNSMSEDSGYRWMTAMEIFLISGREFAEFCFKTPTNFNDVRIRLGFQDSDNDSAPTDGIYIDIAGDTLKGICRDNGAETATALTNYTLIAETWYRGRIKVNDDATSVTFSLYGEAGNLLWTRDIVDDIPDARGLGHGVVCWLDANRGQILLEVDMMTSSQAGNIER